MKELNFQKCSSCRMSYRKNTKKNGAVFFRKRPAKSCCGCMELGEAADVIKKNSDAEIMQNPKVREHFIEEMCDVMMYFNDIMLCYQITPEEFQTIYLAKHSANMKRW